MGERGKRPMKEPPSEEVTMENECPNMPYDANQISVELTMRLGIRAVQVPRPPQIAATKESRRRLTRALRTRTLRVDVSPNKRVALIHVDLCAMLCTTLI